MPSKEGTRCNGKRRAFSLIEVVLALAVVSTALVTCIALNATSLTTLREARKDEQASRICQAVLSEMRSRDFYALPTTTTTLAFDNEGIEVPANKMDSDGVFFAVLSPTFPEIVDLESTRSLSTAKGLRVEVYRGPQTSDEFLVLSRTLLLANRSKQEN